MPDLATLQIEINTIGAEAANRNLGALGENTRKLGLSVNALIERNVRLENENRKLAASAQQTAAGIGSIDRAASRAGLSTGSLASTMGRLVGVFGGIIAARRAVSTIAEFGDIMAQVGAITKDATATIEEQQRQFQALGEAARTIGATTRFGAAEAAEGMLELARAGVSATDIIKELPTVLKFAQAGVIGVGQAAEQTVNTLNQFSLGSEDVVHVLDVIAKSANDSTTNVSEMATAFSYVGRTAANLGLSIEETAALLEALAQGGLKGERGGTALRGILLDLTDDTPKLTRVLKELDLKFKDIDPALVSPIEAFRKLGAAGLTAGQAFQLFGKRGEDAALAVTQATKEIDADTDKLRKVKGTLDELSGALDETLGGAIDHAKNAFAGLALSTGEAGFGGALKFALDLITDAVNALAGLDVPFRTSATAVKLLEGALAGAAAAFVTLKAVQAAEFFLGLAATIVRATAAMLGFNVAVTANPIGLLVTAVGAAVAAFIIFQDEVVSIGETTATVGDIVMGVWDTVVQNIKLFFELIPDLASAAWESIIGGVEALGEPLIGSFQGIGRGLNADWSKSMDGLLQSAKIIANAIIATFKIMADALGLVIKKLAQAVFVIADFDFSSPIESAKALKQGLGDALSPTDFFKELGDNWTKSANRDFVGELVKGFQITGAFLEDTFEKTLENINKRASERAFAKFLEDARAGKLTQGPELPAGFVDPSRPFEPQGPKAPPGFGRNVSLDKPEESVLKTFAALEAESKALGQGNRERQLQNDLLEINLKLRDSQADKIAEIARQLGIEGDTVEDVARAYEERFRAATKQELETDIRKRIEDLQFEQTLIGKTNDEREREIALRQLQKEAAENQVVISADLLKQYDEELKKLQRMAEINRVAEDLAATFADAFSEILDGAISFKDALKKVFEDLQREALDQGLKAGFKAIFAELLGGQAGGGGGGGLAGLFAGLFGGGGGASPVPGDFDFIGPVQSAKGNVFSSQTLVPFARGGLPDLITQPTMFPLRGGRSGLAGEAGDEAIVPLVRTGEGKLGVETSGGGKSTMVNITMNVSTPDVAGFKKSERQIAADLRHRVSQIR